MNDKPRLTTPMRSPAEELRSLAEKVMDNENRRNAARPSIRTLHRWKNNRREAALRIATTGGTGGEL